MPTAIANSPKPRNPQAWVLHAALMAILALVLEFFVESLIGPELMKRAMARAAVPLIGQVYGEGARAGISVVHIDQASLVQARMEWPAPYGYHARVLDAIARARPEAIVVDIIFQVNREDETLKALQETLCQLKGRGIALFLAAPADQPGSRLRAGLEDLSADGKPCFEKVSVVQRRDSYDRTAWTYPLAQTPPAEKPLASAALAVYHARTGDQLLSDLAAAPNMALTWGVLPNQSTRGLSWVMAPRPDGSVEEYCRGWSWQDLLPWYFRSKGFDDTRPVCVFHDSIAVRELLRPESESQYESLVRLLQERVVIYGASFNSGDFVVSPIHDEIPGVYLHAMALDNLLTYRDAWKRDPEHLHGLAWVRSLIPKLVGFFLVSLVFVMSRAVLVRSRERFFDWLTQAQSKPWFTEVVQVVGPLGDRLATIIRKADAWLQEFPSKVFTVLIAGLSVAVARFFWFLFLAGGVGFVVAVIAHHVLNLGVLAYMPVIVFCALVEASDVAETVSKILEKSKAKAH